MHKNQDVDLQLKQYGQRLAMEENGWSVEDFIREFGKNYLEEDEEPEVQSAGTFGWFALTDGELPY